uniref:Uncharacterized protein n=1 Tax=Rhizophora mucronata TaxID=61149 RepID=A0A2P2PP67_RHIMU
MVEVVFGSQTLSKVSLSHSFSLSQNPCVRFGAVLVKRKRQDTAPM